VRGAVQPGDLLEERERAAKYRVSNTPVREALSLLAQEEPERTASAFDADEVGVLNHQFHLGVIPAFGQLQAGQDD
jgi:hypothetical protein